MAKASLNAAWAKKARGEALTAEEEKALRAYHRQRIQASTRIYWDSPEQKQEYEKLAEEQKARNFSKWLIQQIERGAKASPLTRDEVARLHEQIDAANRRLDNETENASFFRKMARDFERERDNAQARLVALVREAEEKDQRIATLLARHGGRA